jgi:hypothetical protein
VLRRDDLTAIVGARSHRGAWHRLCVRALRERSAGATLNSSIDGTLTLEDAMSTRALVLTMAASSFAALWLSACVARHPPWQLYGRPPCADAEDRVERDRERIEALQASGQRSDQLVWYRDDLGWALRSLERCKREHPKTGGNREAK